MGKAPEQRETATGIARLQQAGNTIFQAHNLLSIWLGMQELASWMSAIDQQFLKESISAPYLYDADKRARGEYFTVNKRRILGDLVFEFRPSPINPEEIEHVERGQFIQAVQQTVAMQAEQNVNALAKLMYEKFNVSQADIDKILPAPASIPGLPPGRAEGGARPTGPGAPGAGMPGEEIAGQLGAALETTPRTPE